MSDHLRICMTYYIIFVDKCISSYSTFLTVGKSWWGASQPLISNQLDNYS